MRLERMPKPMPTNNCKDKITKKLLMKYSNRLNCGMNVSSLELKNKVNGTSRINVIIDANAPTMMPWSRNGERINILEAPTKRITSISSLEL